MNQNELKKHFFYDPKNGNFIKKTKQNNRISIGDIAGTITHSGNNSYVHIQFNKKIYRAHRLAFLYMTGSIPEFVDHIDRNGLNNKWSNLRECTRQTNAINFKKMKTKTSKYKGVHFRKTRNKWNACISINKKVKYLGLFSNEKDAAIAYNNAAIKLYGKFAVLNNIKE